MPQIEKKCYIRDQRPKLPLRTNFQKNNKDHNSAQLPKFFILGDSIQWAEAI